MNEVGTLIKRSEIRTDPVRCALKEKEDVFDMKTEQAKIDAMTSQMPFGMGGGAPSQAASEIGSKADKKKKKHK